MHAVSRNQFESVVAQELAVMNAATAQAEFVDTGIMCHVALIPEISKVIKVPRSGEPKIPITENLTIRYLARFTEVPFDRAQHSEYHTSAQGIPCLVKDYVEGDVVDKRRLSQEQRYRYGRDMAHYALALSSSLTPESCRDSIVAQAVEAGVPADWPIIDYGEDEAAGGSLWPLASWSEFTDHAVLSRTLHRCYELRRAYYPMGLNAYRSIVVNNDVRLPNSTFDGSQRLKGIIDPVCIMGNLNFYARGIWSLGCEALKGFNDEIAIGGHQKIPEELAEFHGVAFIAPAVARLVSTQPDSPLLPNLVNLLADTVPDSDWSELRRLTETVRTAVS